MKRGRASLSLIAEIDTIFAVWVPNVQSIGYLRVMNHFVFDSAEAYNSAYGLPTYHPLVTAVDLKESSVPFSSSVCNYGMYAVFLKKGVQCTIKYGRQKYDYQKGSVVTFAPGQKVEFHTDTPHIGSDVLGVLFHPDLILGTPLGEKIHRYGFFDYSQLEAVHLSQQEHDIFVDCFNKIRAEVEHPVDRHSADLLCANIQLMLEYLYRFYDRQFITRHHVNSGVVADFERALREYFDSGRSRDGLPTVSYFAGNASLTPGYFGDLIKKETGTTAQEMISQHIVGVAKHKLLSSDEDVAVIAYDLGFQYPQHFTRLFRRITGMSPTQFRAAVSN